MPCSWLGFSSGVRFGRIRPLSGRGRQAPPTGPMRLTAEPHIPVVWPRTPGVRRTAARRPPAAYTCTRPSLCENCSIAPELGHLSNFTLDSALRAIQCVQWPDMRVSAVPGADFRRIGITKRSRARQLHRLHRFGNTEHADHALEVVGQRVQVDFGGHMRERLHQEVR